METPPSKKQTAIAEALFDIQRQIDDLVALTPSNAQRNEDRFSTAKRVRRVLKARRVRSQFFDETLFADPAWDLLLESFHAYLLEQRTSVTSLCEAAAVPATTALRWLKKLEHDGLLIRKDDTLDRRRSWIELSRDAADSMQRYFEIIDTSVAL